MFSSTRHFQHSIASGTSRSLGRSLALPSVTLVRNYASPTSDPNSKNVFYKGALVNRERLDKLNLGVTKTLIPKPSRPPRKLRQKLYRKWRQQSLKVQKSLSRHKTRLRSREASRTVQSLREGHFDAVDALLKYNMLQRRVGVDVYNKLLQDLALISHKHNLLGEAVQLYDDMMISKDAHPDQFTYYYLILIAAQANHLPRALFFYREYAIRYFINLEPRNLHASILSILWRLIWKHQDADRALALFRSSVQHGFYSPLKADFFLFNDQQNKVRPSYIDQSAVDPELMPSSEFLQKILNISQNKNTAADAVVSTTDSSTAASLQTLQESSLLSSAPEATQENIEQFIQKMHNTVDPTFFSDLYELPNSSEMDTMEQYHESNIDPKEDAIEVFKHYFGKPSKIKMGAPMTLHQHQERRQQQLEAEIEKASQVDILGKLKKAANNNWVSSEFKFSDVMDEAYTDFRRLWIEKSKKDPRDILLEHANLHHLSSVDLFAAKVLERRRHRLTAALLSSDNFGEDIRKYQEQYREFRKKAGQLLEVHYRGMRWVPVILGRKGEVFVPQSISVFEITDDKIEEAKKEFIATIIKSEKKRETYYKRFSHRLRIRWFDVEKREFVKDFFYQ